MPRCPLFLLLLSLLFLIGHSFSSSLNSTAPDFSQRIDVEICPDGTTIRSSYDLKYVGYIESMSNTTTNLISPVSISVDKQNNVYYCIHFKGRISLSNGAKVFQSTPYTSGGQLYEYNHIVAIYNADGGLLFAQLHTSGCYGLLPEPDNDFSSVSNSTTKPVYYLFDEDSANLSLRWKKFKVNDLSSVGASMEWEVLLFGYWPLSHNGYSLRLDSSTNEFLISTYLFAKDVTDTSGVTTSFAAGANVLDVLLLSFSKNGTLTKSKVLGIGKSQPSYTAYYVDFQAPTNSSYYYVTAQVARTAHIFQLSKSDLSVVNHLEVVGFNQNSVLQLDAADIGKNGTFALSLFVPRSSVNFTLNQQPIYSYVSPTKFNITTLKQSAILVHYNMFTHTYWIRENTVSSQLARTKVKFDHANRVIYGASGNMDEDQFYARYAGSSGILIDQTLLKIPTSSAAFAMIVDNQNSIIYAVQYLGNLTFQGTTLLSYDRSTDILFLKYAYNCTCDNINCRVTVCYNYEANSNQVCNNRKGTCIGYNTCQCQSEYTGNECQYPICYGKYGSQNVCSKRGACVAGSSGTNICQCNQNYFGSECELFTCDGRAKTDLGVCNGRGNCTDFNTCSCSLPYYGAFCQNTYCSDPVLSNAYKDYCYTGLAGILAGTLTSAFIVILVVICCFVILFVLFVSIVAVKIRKLKQSNELVELTLDSMGPKFVFDSSKFTIQFSDLKDLKEIGSGASGAVVLKGTWKNLPVAVKLFKPSYFNNQTDFTGFEHELKLLFTLRHNNIILLYGAAMENNRVAIVLEYASKGTLSHFITANKTKMNWDTKKSLLIDIARGMAYLHGQGIMHRDLKSDNVLITEQNVAKISDFGLSRSREQNASQQMTKRVGTSAYMSPEMTMGDQYDEKSDVFSYAIIIYEMLFETNSPYGEDVNYFNLEVKVAMNANYRPRIPVPLPSNREMKVFIALMMKCWSHTSADRPSFEEILSIIDNPTTLSSFDFSLLMQEESPSTEESGPRKVEKKKKDTATEVMKQQMNLVSVPKKKSKEEEIELSENDKL